MDDISSRFEENQEDDDEWIDLTLSLPSPPQSPPSTPPRPSPPPPTSPPRAPFQFTPLALPLNLLPSATQQSHPLFPPPPPPPPLQDYEMPEPEPQVQETASSSSRPVWAKKKPKNDPIIAPYPWATSKRATVHSLEHLLARGIRTISGKLHCKNCKAKLDVVFDLQEKFNEIVQFIRENRDDMNARAPESWINPLLPKCDFCGKGLKPVISKKKTINWLFLLLGQMLGCCTLSQLKYFCKYTECHYIGARNRLLYLTYMGLCKQLHPEGPYDV